MNGKPRFDLGAVGKRFFQTAVVAITFLHLGVTAPAQSTSAAKTEKPEPAQGKIPSIKGKFANGTIGDTKVVIEFLPNGICFIGGEGKGTYKEDGFGNLDIVAETKSLKTDGSGKVTVVTETKAIFLAAIDGDAIIGGRVTLEKGFQEWRATLEPNPPQRVQSLLDRHLEELKRNEPAPLGSGKSDLQNLLESLPEPMDVRKPQKSEQQPNFLKNILDELASQQAIEPDRANQPNYGVNSPRSPVRPPAATTKLKQAVKNTMVKEGERLNNERREIAQAKNNLDELRKKNGALPDAQAKAKKNELDAKQTELYRRTIRMKEDMKIWNHGTDQWDWKWKDQAGKGQTSDSTKKTSSPDGTTKETSPSAKSGIDTAQKPTVEKSGGGQKTSPAPAQKPTVGPSAGAQDVGSGRIPMGSTSQGPSGAPGISKSPVVSAPATSTKPSNRTPEAKGTPKETKNPTASSPAKENALAELALEKQRQQEQINLVRQQQQKLEARRTALVADQAKLQATKDALRQQAEAIAAAKRKLAPEKSALDNSLKQLVNQKTAIDAVVQRLNQDNQKIKSLRESRSGDLAHLRTFSSELHAEKSALDAAARSLTQESSALEAARPASITILGQSNYRQVAEFNERVARHNARLSQYKGRQGQYNGKVAQYNQKATHYDAQVKQDNQLVQAYAAQHNEYRAADQRFKAARDQYQKKAQIYDTEVQQIQKQVAAYRTTAAQYDSQRARLEQERNSIDAQQSGLATRLASLQKQMQDLGQGKSVSKNP